MNQVVAIPKYSAEDTSLAIGNEAGETTMTAVPAGTWITIDAVGLHYNRKIHFTRRANLCGLHTAIQRGTGTAHILLTQKGLWENGIRTLLSRSLGARGGVSDEGNLLPIQFDSQGVSPPGNLDFSRRRGWPSSRP